MPIHTRKDAGRSSGGVFVKDPTSHRAGTAGNWYAVLQYHLKCMQCNEDRLCL